MSLTRKLLDMGGGAIAGTLIAVTITSEPLLVVVAMFISAVIAAVIPLIGAYSGIAAMMGLIAAIVLRLEGVSTWPTFVISGFALGCAHLLILALTRHDTSSMNDLPASRDARSVEMHNDELFVTRWNYTKLGPVSLFVGSSVGAVVGLLVGGPAHVGSYFFCGCVVIGTVAGAALLLGLLASSVVTTYSGRLHAGRKHPVKNWGPRQEQETKPASVEPSTKPQADGQDGPTNSK